MREAIKMMVVGSLSAAMALAITAMMPKGETTPEPTVTLADYEKLVEADKQHTNMIVKNTKADAGLTKLFVERCAAVDAARSTHTDILTTLVEAASTAKKERAAMVALSVKQGEFISEVAKRSTTNFKKSIEGLEILLKKIKQNEQFLKTGQSSARADYLKIISALRDLLGRIEKVEKRG